MRESICVCTRNNDYNQYHEFMNRVQDRFMKNTDDGSLPLFTTDAALWEKYLVSVEKRAH